MRWRGPRSTVRTSRRPLRHLDDEAAFDDAVTVVLDSDALDGPDLQHSAAGEPA